MWAGALYYPYMRVRDTNWLKAAALYWDSMRRFQPPDYPLRDSLVGEQFAEAGFLRSLNPERYSANVSNDLLRFMRENTDALRQQFSISAALATQTGPGWGTEGPKGGQPGLGWVHSRKMSREFSGFLTSEGLGQVGRGSDDRWVGLHPTVAAAYMLALVGACARHEGLAPVTDYPSPLLSPTQGVEAAIRLLATSTMLNQPSRDHSRDAAGFAILAIESVAPRNLTEVSVQRILDTKNKLEEELTEFRNFMTAQQPELERLASIQSSDIRAEAFAAHINTEIKKPLQRLERGLKQSGINTVRSLLTMQVVTPPALVLGVNELAQMPPTLTVVETVGVTIGTAWWQLVKDRRKQIRESPVGYLLSVKKALSARTVVERTAELLGRVY